MAFPGHFGVAGVKKDPIHTPKSTSKPSKSLVIKFLVLSTPLRVLVLG